jgi:microcystin-dependent protein
MTQISPPLIIVPFASGGDQSTLPQTDPNGFVNYTTGYTPDYEINLASGDPNAKGVERGIQNYLFNALTTAVQAWQTSNRPPWYSGMPGGYAKYAEVWIADSSGNPQPYRSMIAGNVQAPSPTASQWQYIESTSEMIANVPMPSGGASGPGSLVINASTDFNTFATSGTFVFSSDAVVQGSPHPPSNGGNQAGAGTLEVMAWSDQSSNNYISQMFRDRNGLGYMRGAINGNWTAWKIWANSFQYVVGEVRMWAGTPTDVAVQAAYGPGWHVCNGQNGTPNLAGVFPLGAGTGYSQGSTGGSNTVTLSQSNLPAHNHAVAITDNGHNHAHSDPGHNHSVSDPGHSHGVYDPGHQHSFLPSGPTQPGASAAYQLGSTPVTPQSTGISGTGIAIYGNGTGISNVAATTGVANVAAATGISATTANTGNGAAVTTTPPYYAITFIMYTGS